MTLRRAPQPRPCRGGYGCGRTARPGYSRCAQCAERDRVRSVALRAENPALLRERNRDYYQRRGKALRQQQARRD